MSQRQRSAWVGAVKEQALRNAETSDGHEADLMELYGECMSGLESKIRAFYSRCARDNQLTEAQAPKLLTGKEYSTWKKPLEGYLEELESQGKDSRLALELNTLAAKNQVSRREQLLTDVYRNMSHLVGRSETELTGLLKSFVQTNYEHKMFDIQSIGDMARDVLKASERLLEQILSYPWNERQYSKTLWGNTDQLTALTHHELTLGFINGASVDRIAKETDDVMGGGRHAIQHPVRMEASYFADQGQLLAYQDAGVTKYRFLGGGCEVCQYLNGQMFELSDARAGGNLPPIHPNCKYTTVAVYDMPVFRQRQGNPLENNPKFEEWKKKHMEEVDQVGSGPGQEPVRKGIFASLKERQEATGLPQPYISKVKVTGEVNQANYRKAAAELEWQLAKAPFQRLDEITIFDSRDAPGRVGSAVGKQLRMGMALMNASGKHYEGSVLSWTKRTETSMGKLWAGLNEGASEVTREVYGRQMGLKHYNRGNALYNSREVACVIQHEMMHIIVSETEMRNDRELKECYNRTTKGGDIYGISYRVSGNEQESIYEAAVMCENGESVLEYIKRLVKECRSHGA